MKKRTKKTKTERKLTELNQVQNEYRGIMARSIGAGAVSKAIHGSQKPVIVT